MLGKLALVVVGMLGKLMLAVVGMFGKLTLVPDGMETVKGGVGVGPI